MNNTIWKYELDPYNPIIEMPKGAEILSIKTQYGYPCIWVLVNPEQELEKRYFEIFGTGHDMPIKAGYYRKYLETFLMDNGNLVFHVFEIFPMPIREVVELADTPLYCT